MTTSEAPADLSALMAYNTWAEGCEQCRYGVASLPDVEPLAVPLYVAYAFYWRFGLLLPCDCEAGQAAEAYLREQWKKIETERETPLTWSTVLHQEIQRVQAGPSVHGEGE